MLQLKQNHIVKSSKVGLFFLVKSVFDSSLNIIKDLLLIFTV
jgi:hypothetical protein